MSEHEQEHGHHHDHAHDHDNGGAHPGVGSGDYLPGYFETLERSITELLVYTPTLGASGGATLQQANGGPITGNNIYAGYLGWTTAGSSYSASAFSAEQASGVGTNASAQSFINGLSGLAITSTNASGFTVVQPLITSGSLIVNANGISIPNAISSGGSLQLNALNGTDINATASITAGGAIDVTGRNITLGAVNWANSALNVTATGAVNLNGAALVNYDY